MTQATNDRVVELCTQLDEAEARLTKRRADLGAAVADGDEVRAATLRAEIRTLESRAGELGAAVPVAEQRAEEAREREDRERRTAEAHLHNERRDAKLAAAAKVDKAMRALGRAWREFASLPEVSGRAARRRPASTRAALLHWAMDFASELEVQRVPRNHWRPFAQAEEETTPPKETESE